MKFKNTVAVAAICAGVLGVTLNANAAATADVTLEGVITATTCDITVNGGQSTLDVGIYRSADFIANTRLGDVSLPVELTNCSKDESGELIIKGVTSTGNANQNIFVGNDNNTVGFMIANAASETVTNGAGPVVAVKKDEGGSYNFVVGMASTTVNPAAGAYSAPIMVAYLVN